MNIKNQFIICIAFFSIILVIIAGSVAVTAQQVAQLNVQEEIAKKIERGASSLNSVSIDYFLYQEDLQLSRWQSEVSSLSSDLLILKLHSAQQEALADNLTGDLQRLNELFGEVVFYLQSASRNVSVRIDPPFQIRWSSMAVQGQTLAADASKLSALLDAQAHQVNDTNNGLIVSLVGTFGGFLATIYLIFFRRTLKSIAELQNGINTVGKGNLDYSIKIEGQNEITELSRAFNQMSTNLKTVTASKTDLEQAEASLRESEQRWATTLASIGDAVIATDLRGRIVFMNCVAEELTGWKLNEASIKPVNEIFNIVNELTRLKVEDPVSKVLEKGMIVGLANHTVLIRKDGTNVAIDDSGAPIKGKEGNITGVVLIFRDITQRKQAEAETQRQNDVQAGISRIFQEVLSASTEEDLGEICLDVVEKITHSEFGFIGELNPQGLEDIAISNPGWENCKITDSSSHHRPPGNFKVHGIYGRVLKDGKALFTNDPASHPDSIGLPAGHPPIDSFLGVPLKREGQTIGIVGVGNREGGYTNEQLESLEALAPAIVEAFSRSRAERKLEEYSKNLEAIVEERTKQLKDSERLAAIGATAGMVGHDIRNPLQAITSDIFLAKSELTSFPDSEEKKNALESLEEIGKNTDYINKIVQDLQDYARPLSPQGEETDLQIIIERLLAKNGMPENIKVSVKLENEARKINTDSYYINRIMYNLVTNSIQAMPNGGKLAITARKEANDIVISVKDTGVGIAKELQSKMFTPMFTTKAKGQGFGLPVVKRMTEALGGKVTFESEVGNGTTFKVRLPQGE